ncbi:MAG: hypothetical protein GXW85_05505 [Clostridia bacterium]|nr:hypothetical protein [Clostridia bacterium]
MMNSSQKVASLYKIQREKRKLNKKRKFAFPKLSRLLIYGLLAYLVFTFSHGFYQAYHLKQEIKVLEAKLSKVKEDNMTLEQELEYSQTPEAIEKIAREKLGLIKPGETVILRAREAQQ